MMKMFSLRGSWVLSVDHYSSAWSEVESVSDIYSLYFSDINQEKIPLSKKC